MALKGIAGATVWSSIQRFGGLAISFISNMILARLLSPDDFGVVGLIMVFISISDVLVDGGLGNALIQKKELEEGDRTTLFTTNLAVSLFLFALLFVLAPLLETYTNIEGFKVLLRVQSICVLIRAFYVVNVSQITRDLRYPTLARITLISQFVATTVAVIMAYCGLGVWSLLLKTILLDLLCCVMYAVASPFKYKLSFDGKLFKGLFSFGFPVALANLIESLYANTVSFIIGKAYSVKDLGYFNQANSLKQIPVYSISAVINQVFFPFFSRIQDDKKALAYQYGMTIRVVTFFIYPILSFLVFFAEPVITVIYSSKWIPCVPLFQVLCFSGYLNALYHLSRSTIKAVGKSRLLLITQLISLIVSLSCVLLFLRYDIQTFVWVIVIDAVISYSIVGTCIGRHLGYSLLCQVKDWGFHLIVSLATAYALSQVSTIFAMPVLVKLIILFIANIALYFIINLLLKNQVSTMTLNILKNRIIKRNNV